MSGMGAIYGHEDGLARDFRRLLAGVPGALVFSPADGVDTTPTVAFTLSGRSPRSVAAYLAQHGLLVGDGNFYASTLAQRVGTMTTGGWVRVGLAPYTTAEELARCLAALQRIGDG